MCYASVMAKLRNYQETTNCLMLLCYSKIGYEMASWLWLKFAVGFNVEMGYYIFKDVDRRQWLKLW